MGEPRVRIYVDSRKWERRGHCIQYQWVALKLLTYKQADVDSTNILFMLLLLLLLMMIKDN